MIVPRFTVTQTDTLVIVRIHVPYIRVSEAEIFAENNEFTFYCKPYFLKLAFQGELSSDDNCNAKYDPNEENGTIIAELPKIVPGTFFPDLDLPMKLLLDRKRADSSKFQFPSIEVVGESSHPSSLNEEDLESTPISNLLPSQYCYGFNQKYSNVLRHQRDEILMIFTLPNPDEVSPYHRRAMRLEHENSSFDEDRYLGDYLEGSSDPIHIEALSFKPFWEEMWSQKKCSTSHVSESHSEKTLEEECFQSVGWTEEEAETMRQLPKRSLFRFQLSIFNINRSYLGENAHRSLYLSLIDILFAYCYDHRTTQGEPTVESCYTISILSPTLSSFEDYFEYPHGTDDSLLFQRPSKVLTLREVLVQSAKRTLIYPYLRTWKLVKKIYVDVTKILFLGQRCILKCFLQIHRIFEKSENYYLLNKLFIEDYCIWLQYLDSPGKTLLTELANECNSLKSLISKRDLHELNIEELEKSLQAETQTDYSQIDMGSHKDRTESATGVDEEVEQRKPRIEVVSSVQFDEESEDT